MPQRVLRPLDYGALFDELFDIYKRNFVLLAGVAALLMVPINVIMQLTLYKQIRAIYPTPGSASAPDPLIVIPILGWSLAAIFVDGIIRNVVMGVSTQAISGIYLGRKPTILEAYKAIVPRIPMFLLLMVSVETMEAAGTMFCCIPGIVLGVLFAFVPQVFVIEGRSFADSIRRSWEMAKSEWVRVFVVGLITYLIAMAVQLAISLPAQFAQQMVVKAGWSLAGFTGILAALQGLGQALVLPVQVIAFVLLYYDIRVRREGFDIEMLAQSMGGGTPSPIRQEPPSFDLGKSDDSRE